MVTRVGGVVDRHRRPRIAIIIAATTRDLALGHAPTLPVSMRVATITGSVLPRGECAQINTFRDHG